MRMPRAAARFNRRVTNPVVRRFAGRAPMFAVVEHSGRTSGRRYRTPVNVFPTSTGFVVLLGYGTETQWVKNVLAAGSATLRHRGTTIGVTQPQMTTKADAATAVRPTYRQLYRAFPYNESALLLTRHA